MDTLILLVMVYNRSNVIVSCLEYGNQAVMSQGEKPPPLKSPLPKRAEKKKENYFQPQAITRPSFQFSPARHPAPHGVTLEEPSKALPAGCVTRGTI